MKENDLLEQVLVSQDSGWYNVGDAKGGNFKPYTCVITQFYSTTSAKRIYAG